MTTDARDLIVEQLDATLREQIDAEEAYHDARRISDAALQRTGEIEGRAQRLRMALFALDGEKADMAAAYRMGDANSANRERLNELKRGETR